MSQSLSSPALARVAERFAARMPERLNSLEAAAEALSNDSDGHARAELERMLHDIAGTAPILGYSALGERARDGEDIVAGLRTASADARGDLIRAVQDQLRQLRREAQTQGIA